GRVSSSVRAIRSNNRNRIQSWLQPGMPVQVKVRHVGLALGFEQGGSLLQEGNPKIVGAGPNRNPDVEILIDSAVILPVSWGRHLKQLATLTVHRQFNLIGSRQAFDSN